MQESLFATDVAKMVYAAGASERAKRRLVNRKYMATKWCSCNVNAKHVGQCQLACVENECPGFYRISV